MEVTIEESGVSITSKEAAVSSPVTKFIDWEESGGLLTSHRKHSDVK